MRVADVVGIVAEERHFITPATDSCGLTERINAAAPATCGVAIEVPAISVRQLPCSPYSVLGAQLPAKLWSLGDDIYGVEVQMFSIQWR